MILYKLGELIALAYVITGIFTVEIGPKRVLY